jgi:hypothetical protein
VLDARKDWIDFSFTPLAIKLGKYAAPVCVVRLFVTRLDEEAYGLSILFGAAFQYLVFKAGADVHIFWSIYFAPYFALAMAQLSRTIGTCIGFVVGRFARSARGPVVAWVALAAGLVPPVLMTRDGVASLWVWRRTGGRYDDNGQLTRSHLDLQDVLTQVIIPNVVRGTPIDTSGSAEWYWENEWEYQGINNDVAIPEGGARDAAAHPFWIGRGSGIFTETQRKIAGLGHLRIYGDVWVVDQREPRALPDVYALNEREPNVFEWLFLEGTEPRRKVGAQPDPWLTWEYRAHLGVAAIEPVGDPQTLDQMRVAHNLAVAHGDEQGAARWLAAIEARLERSVTARWESIDLVGVRMIRGVEPRLEEWFLATDKPSYEAGFSVRSKVEAKAHYSLIPVTSMEREMAWPPSIPTKMWRAGFLYRQETVLNHRIGRERYFGRWQSRDGGAAPKRIDRKGDVTLAIVE